MAEFYIRYGVQTYEYADVISAYNLEAAEEHAWRAALENLDSYGGLHGYPHCGECLECSGSGLEDCWDDSDEREDCSECGGSGSIEWDDFVEQAESWIVYSALTIEDARKHGMVDSNDEAIYEEMDKEID